MMSFMLTLLFGMVASRSTPKGQTETPAPPDGHKIRKCEFPNMAILKVHTENGTKFCAGSLVSLKNVVSSAECVPTDVKYVEVFLGGSSLNKMQQKILVNHSAIHIHPQYKQTFNKSQLPVNDVAFITLPEQVKVNHCIAPIQLATTTDTYYPLCATAGWKKISESGRIAKHLQSGNAALISEAECRNAVPHLHFNRICGETLRKGNNQMCQTDIGSALMCWRLFDNQLVLLGISSSNVGCDYGIKVFTGLSDFLAYDDEDHVDDHDDDDDNHDGNDDGKKNH